MYYHIRYLTFYHLFFRWWHHRPIGPTLPLRIEKHQTRSQKWKSWNFPQWPGHMASPVRGTWTRWRPQKDLGIRCFVKRKEKKVLAGGKMKVIIHILRMYKITYIMYSIIYAIANICIIWILIPFKFLRPYHLTRIPSFHRGSRDPRHSISKRPTSRSRLAGTKISTSLRCAVERSHETKLSGWWLWGTACFGYE